MGENYPTSTDEFTGFQSSTVWFVTFMASTQHPSGSVVVFGPQKDTVPKNNLIGSMYGYIYLHLPYMDPMGMNQKTTCNMTIEQHNHLKMHFLGRMVIFHWHVSLPEDLFDYFGLPRNTFVWNLGVWETNISPFPTDFPDFNSSNFRPQEIHEPFLDGKSRGFNPFEKDVCIFHHFSKYKFRVKMTN